MGPGGTCEELRASVAVSPMLSVAVSAADTITARRSRRRRARATAARTKHTAAAANKKDAAVFWKPSALAATAAKSATTKTPARGMGSVLKFHLGARHRQLGAWPGGLGRGRAQGWRPRRDNRSMPKCGAQGTQLPDGGRRSAAEFGARMRLWSSAPDSRPAPAWPPQSHAGAASFPAVRSNAGERERISDIGVTQIRPAV